MWPVRSATGISNVQVYARDTEDLVRLVNDVIGTIPGVARVRALIVPWKLKEVFDWRVPVSDTAEGAAMD